MDVLALNVVLEGHEPGQHDLSDPNIRKEWCHRICAVQPHVESLCQRLQSEHLTGPRTKLILGRCRFVEMIIIVCLLDYY